MRWVIEGLVPRMIKEDFYDLVYAGLKVHYKNALKWSEPPQDYDPLIKRIKLPWTKLNKHEFTGIYMGAASKIQYQGWATTDGVPDGRGVLIASPKGMTLSWFKDGMLHGPYVQFNYGKLLSGVHRYGTHLGAPLVVQIAGYQRKSNSANFGY